MQKITMKQIRVIAGYGTYGNIPQITIEDNGIITEITHFPLVKQTSIEQYLKETPDLLLMLLKDVQ